MEGPILYEYNGRLIEELPYFLYEVCIYKISKNSANMLSSRYYIANKLLKVEENKITNKFKNFIIQRFINLLGVPKYFIEDNNLKIHEIKKRKRNENKQSRNSDRLVCKSQNR